MKYFTLYVYNVHDILLKCLPRCLFRPGRSLFFTGKLLPFLYLSHPLFFSFIFLVDCLWFPSICEVYFDHLISFFPLDIGATSIHLRCIEDDPFLRKSNRRFNRLILPLLVPIFFYFFILETVLLLSFTVVCTSRFRSSNVPAQFEIDVQIETDVEIDVNIAMYCILDFCVKIMSNFE